MKQEFFDTPQEVASEDVVVLKAEHSVMFQQCCGCGLTHKIEVSPRESDLRMRFVNIGYSFPADLVIQNYIERPEATQ